MSMENESSKNVEYNEEKENNEKENNEKENNEKEKPKIMFWGNNPNTLLDPSHVFELFPTEDMQYEQKLNAVTRTVILLCFIFYFILRTSRVVIVGVLTIIAIWLLYISQKKNKKVHFNNDEGFRANNLVNDYTEQYKIPSDIFSEATETNPLQNVMLSDYETPSNKKPAPASYTQQSQEDILNNTKNMIDMQHPEEPKITDRLFQSLGDKLEFEQSMRPFYSNASTTIPNDQGAFADFCYGSMVSCKEGNPFACARNLARHTN